jgi:hypothetical protein
VSTGFEVAGVVTASVGAFELWGVGVGLVVCGAAAVLFGYALGDGK